MGLDHRTEHGFRFDDLRPVDGRGSTSLLRLWFSAGTDEKTDKVRIVLCVFFVHDGI